MMTFKREYFEKEFILFLKNYKMVGGNNYHTRILRQVDQNEPTIKINFEDLEEHNIFFAQAVELCPIEAREAIIEVLSDVVKSNPDKKSNKDSTKIVEICSCDPSRQLDSISQMPITA